LSQWFATYQRTILGAIAAAAALLLYNFISTSVDIAEFLDAFKKFPIFSPVFCFGAPAFWRKSLEDLRFSAEDISLLGGTSVLAGVVFLAGLLLLLVAKHVRSSELVESDTFERKRAFLLKASLVANCVGLGTFAFVCLEISVLTFCRLHA